MKKLVHFFVISFILIGCQASKPKVSMQTELGEIQLVLYPKKAPLTVANFLRYVDEGRWGSTNLYGAEAANFYRVVRLDNQPNNAVKIEVIQGGLRAEPHPYRLAPIAVHETTAQSGIKHLNGTISMARAAVGTAASEFFICINDQPSLDFGGNRNPDGQGFAAFGRVVRGMEVVRAIQQQSDKSQYLEKPIKITSVKRVK